MEKHRYIKFIIALIFALAAYIPTFIWMVDRWVAAEPDLKTFYLTFANPSSSKTNISCL